jgi:hypothetical protein
MGGARLGRFVNAGHPVRMAPALAAAIGLALLIVAPFCRRR